MPHPDEIWTTRDGQRITVGDMDPEHVRNVLRMILRKQRQAAESTIRTLVERLEMTVGEAQDELNAWHYNALANPQCFFPGLDGGVYGSPELQKKYGR